MAMLVKRRVPFDDFLHSGGEGALPSIIETYGPNKALYPLVT